jgi:hypothetical protein
VSELGSGDASWETALDALESLVQRQRAFIDGAGPLPDAPWVAPAAELPSTLRVRALSLAATCADIEAQLHDLLQRRTDRAVSPYR